MSAEGWAAVAAWVGVAGTAAAAWWGIRQAKYEAKAANAEAQCANDHAAKANEIAAAANAHSERAVALAEAAEERAARLEDVSFESRDVQWDRVDVEDGETVSIRNVGTDRALEVSLVVDPEGYRRQTSSQPYVDPDTSIGIRLAAIAREERQKWAEAGSDGVLVTPGFRVRARVTWKSESGVPGSESWDDLWIS